jgi:WD40 repeat protein
MKVRFLIIMMLSMVGFISAMNERDLERTARRERAQQRRNNTVWVKVKDVNAPNGTVVKEVPLWQMQQMTELQGMLQNQVNGNSERNPLDVSMITVQQLALIQLALQKVSDLVDFHHFCQNLVPDEKNDLINAAFAVDAQGLISLIMNEMFSVELQEKLGATIAVSGIMKSVIKYLTVEEVVNTTHQNRILSLACSFNNQYIVSSSFGQGGLILYDVATGKETPLLDEPFKGCQNIVYSPDGNYIAAVSSQPTDNFIIFDGKTGRQLQKINVLTGYNVNSPHRIAFSPDSKRFVAIHPTIASNKPAYKMIIGNVITGETIYAVDVYALQAIFVATVSWSVSGDIVLCYSSNENREYVKIYDGTKYNVKKMHAVDRVNVLASPDGHYLLDTQLSEVVNFASGKVICTVPKVVFTACWSSDSKHLIMTSSDHSLFFVDIATGKISVVLEKPSYAIQTVIISPDGRFIIFAEQNNIHILNCINPDVLMFMAEKLNIAQARLLYRLYLARIKGVRVTIHQNDFDYQIYLTLSEDVRDVVNKFLPFTLSNAS